MPATSEKYATRVNSEILSGVRSLANEEGRPLQALVKEALADLIKKRKKATPRAHVMGAYLASHGKYASLYKKLAE
jgi:hypothetical protein